MVPDMPSTSERPVNVDKLPFHLSKRVRVIYNAPLRVNGDFVLCWMHHAVRNQRSDCVVIGVRCPGWKEPH